VTLRLTDFAAGRTTFLLAQIDLRRFPFFALVLVPCRSRDSGDLDRAIPLSKTISASLFHGVFLS
jgi:hypothetical protein